MSRNMLISVRYHVLLTQEQTQRKLFQCLTMSASVATELLVELVTTTVLHRITIVGAIRHYSFLTYFNSYQRAVGS